MKKRLIKCEECGKKDNLMKAKNDLGEGVYICKECYNSLCEGYRLIK
ncbi:hypothetical protein J4434_00560 [Candidatus Woesearchaeota archaeon]|nr:hypothetical protein [Candidatus Woesearchaeota archaeon]